MPRKKNCEQSIGENVNACTAWDARFSIARSDSKGLLLDVAQRCIKDQICIGWNRSGAGSTIAIGSRNCEHSTFAKAHVPHSKVPALNDLHGADVKGEPC